MKFVTGKTVLDTITFEGITWGVYSSDGDINQITTTSVWNYF